MATLAVPPLDPVVPAVVSSSISPGVDASIDAYLGAGDQMARTMGLVMIVCAALVLLIAAAWAFRLLPGAV